MCYINWIIHDVACGAAFHSAWFSEDSSKSIYVSIFPFYCWAKFCGVCTTIRIAIHLPQNIGVVYNSTLFWIKLLQTFTYRFLTSIIYYSGAALGLRCGMQALPIVACGLLSSCVPGLSSVWLRHTGLVISEAHGILVTWPGFEPASPALGGGFLTSELPQTSPPTDFYVNIRFYFSGINAQESSFWIV